MCKDCLYFGMGCDCENVSECEYYYSVYEDEEVIISDEELRNEYYDAWIDYVSPYADFDFDSQYNKTVY